MEMIKLKLYYLGSFPPPYGGVTIKNHILFKNIIKHLNCEIIDFSKIKNKNLSELMKLIKVLVSRSSHFVIGIASDKRRENFTRMLYLINKKAMRNSIIMIMGGISHTTIVSKESYKKWMRNYKMIYVETNSMMTTLNNAGLTNVKIFPNCRENPGIPKKEKKSDHVLKCVFFSKISKEKGVDTIIEASDRLVKNGIKVNIDLYGEIDDDYNTEFKEKILQNQALRYKGIFEQQGDNVYYKLQEYDLLLFPTKWKNEGVPGILIESKIASLPAIASDINYNSEIVNNGEDGIVIRQNNVDDLYKAILLMYNNRELLYKMSLKAKKSAEKYFIDNYINEIIELLK
ncbi:MAG TPA: glycosyltransferase family 4 protein [Clostridiales bacterium]|nr:glycosyltransferase family 4 protein [Clostridiales bacterium]